MNWIKRGGLYIAKRELELPAPHHSLSDWDFRSGETYALDNSIYVSSPSSLRITKPGTTGTYASCCCRDSGTLDLPQGRLETYWRASSTGIRPIWVFRNQSSPGTISQTNTYWVAGVASGVFNCQKLVGGSATAIGSWTLAWSANTWYNRRCTWWKEAAALLIRFEYWDGSAWQLAGTDLTDSSPAFEGSGTNRVGFGWSSGSTSVYIIYYDDGVIYGPV